MHTTATFVDIAHRTAAIPGSGDVPVAFTYSRDVAQFVSAFLDLDKWEQSTFIVGDKVTFNELVKIAEETTGNKHVQITGDMKLTVPQVTSSL
jgi:nucleoside-diphosphate-sugar epimerase